MQRRLATHCCELRQLVLSHCSSITDGGVIPLVRGCRNLEVLDMYCCHRITDEAVSKRSTSIL